MSDNGSGVYNVNSTGQPVVTDTPIMASVFNAYTADAATAMSNRICKDGQTTVIANIPMGGYKFTGVGAGSARTDSCNLGNVQDGTGVYVATVGGTADAITLTPSPAITAYVAGQTFRFITSGANTGAVTVAVSGLAAKAITKNGTTALAASDLPSGMMVEITYDGTRFILCTPSSAVLNGTTLNTATLASPTITTPAVTGGTLTSPTLAGTPVFPDNVFTIGGSADATKKLAFEVDGLTTATTRILTPPNQDLVMANIWVGQNDFRLSLTSAVPVTGTDVIGAGTLYAVPYVGNRIALYTGTTWVLRTSTQFSLALTLTSGKPYDIFCYDNAGVPTLEVLVWTNDTTRATATAYQDGVMVKFGDATRRYLGSLYASGVNTTEDSYAKRYLWNYYHRLERPMKVVDLTDSWTYTTAVYRQANGSAANQIECMLGATEDPVQITATSLFNNSASTAVAATGVGVDSTTAQSATVYTGGKGETGSVHKITLTAYYQGFPGVGRHFFPWLEFSEATGTTTFYGDNGTGFIQTGLIGVVRG